MREGKKRVGAAKLPCLLWDNKPSAPLAKAAGGLGTDVGEVREGKWEVRHFCYEP